MDKLLAELEEKALHIERLYYEDEYCAYVRKFYYGRGTGPTHYALILPKSLKVELWDKSYDEPLGTIEVVNDEELAGLADRIEGWLNG